MHSYECCYFKKTQQELEEQGAREGNKQNDEARNYDVCINIFNARRTFSASCVRCTNCVI